MDHDTFVGQVQNRARLASRGEAERVIRATLETLSLRLEGGLADNIAAQLPHEIGRHLQTMLPYTKLSLDDFLVQIADEEGADLPEATFHARAVLEVLGEALTGGAMDKIREQLPPEFSPLFEAGSRGEMRPQD